MTKVAYMLSIGEQINVATDLGSGKEATGKKFMNEISKRLNTLTEKQTNILVKGDLTSQKQIAFLSICKSHLFVRDFAVEVIREKLLVYDYQLSEGEYISFLEERVKTIMS